MKKEEFEIEQKAFDWWYHLTSKERENYRSRFKNEILTPNQIVKLYKENTQCSSQ